MTAALPILYPIIRGLILLTLLALVGTQVATWIVTRNRPLVGATGSRAQPFRALPFLLALLLLLLSAARGAAQLWSLKDPSEPLDGGLVRAILSQGSWGHAWLVQSAAALVLLLVLARRAPLTGWRPALVSFLVLVACWAQTGMGHAASRFWGAWAGRAIDLSHLLGAGGWLGTLAILAIAVFPSMREARSAGALAGTLRDFSAAAQVGAVLLVLSGTVTAVVYAGSVTALGTTAWGRLLLLKLLCLVGVAGLGWYNWKVVTPAIVAEAPDGAERLRRAVRFELLLGLLIIAITAVLVASPLPREL